MRGDPPRGDHEEIIKVITSAIDRLQKLRTKLTGSAEPQPAAKGRRSTPRGPMLISVQEAAELIGVSESTVRTLAARGRLQAWRSTAGRWSISKEDARRLRDSRKRRP